MQSDALAQRTISVTEGRIHSMLPLGETLGAFHPNGAFPLVEDPRRTDRAAVLGMMVLRPANVAWMARSTECDVTESLLGVRDWCYDVDGIGGSWAISGGSVLDAYRLALQYGTVDAVLAGASTVAREGLVAGARRGHLWQPYTPLSWAVLAPWRDMLEPAIAALRRDWQELGVLSPRRYPAQIAISASGLVHEGQPDILDARMFHDRHPDGSAMESYILTSRSGAERLRERAASKGRNIEDQLIVLAAPGEPDAIDLELLPRFLRQRFDMRLVEHDGGATTLEAFERAGALSQLNLTLMRGRSVRQVVETTGRLDATEREKILESWEGRPRLYPRDGGSLGSGRFPAYVMEEASPDGEAVVVSFTARS